MKKVITDLVIPVDNKNNIDYKELKQLIEFQIKNNVNGILIKNKKNNYIDLNNVEFKKIIIESKKILKNKAKLIVETSSNSTVITMRKSKIAEIYDADFLLIKSPFLFKKTDDEIFKFFKDIADYVNTPIILLNNPENTGNYISIKNVIELSKHKNIVGICDKSGIVEYLEKIKENVNKDFFVLTGKDNNIYETLKINASGVISKISNFKPDLPVEIVKRYDEEKEKSKLAQQKLCELENNLLMEIYPSIVNEVLKIMGFKSMNSNIPNSVIKDKNEENIIKILKKY